MWWNEKYSSERRRQNDISCLYTFQRKEESSLPLEYHQSATRELHNISRSRSLLPTFYSAFFLFVFLPSSRKVSIQSPFLISSGLLLELFLFFLFASSLLPSSSSSLRCEVSAYASVLYSTVYLISSISLSLLVYILRPLYSHPGHNIQRIETTFKKCKRKGKRPWSTCLIHDDGGKQTNKTRKNKNE